VILAGAFGLTVATVAFGFSKSFIGILAARAISGLFSGNIGVIPVAVMQITDASNQAFAFSRFGIWWPLGAIFGCVELAFLD
jgi:MFS family permease